MRTRQLVIRLGTSFLSAATACSTPIEPSVSLQTVLERNAVATRSEIDAPRLNNTDKTLCIKEGGQALIARYRATSDGMMRIDVYDLTDRVFSEGKDDDGTWEWPAGHPAPVNVEHAGVGALAHGIEFNLFSPAELAARGHDVELTGQTRIRETDYFVLKITLQDGFETYRYVNPDTWLIDIARDFRAFHPAIDSTEQSIETRFDQWRLADGVRFAGRTRNFDVASGALIATVEILESAYDVERTGLDLARTYASADPPESGRQCAR